jgi:hypothetical protein
MYNEGRMGKNIIICLGKQVPVLGEIIESFNNSQNSIIQPSFCKTG